MTGPKEKKGVGSKQQQQSGGALFPRLHVAETKRSGPRAPPRNKMALYEQFTIPSHTFKASPMPLPSNSSRMVSTPPLNMVYQPIQPQVRLDNILLEGLHPPALPVLYIALLVCMHYFLDAVSIFHVGGMKYVMVR